MSDNNVSSPTTSDFLADADVPGSTLGVRILVWNSPTGQPRSMHIDLDPDNNLAFALSAMAKEIGCAPSDIYAWTDRTLLSMDDMVSGIVGSRKYVSVGEFLSKSAWYLNSTKDLEKALGTYERFAPISVEELVKVLPRRAIANRPLFLKWGSAFPVFPFDATNDVYTEDAVRFLMSRTTFGFDVVAWLRTSLWTALCGSSELNIVLRRDFEMYVSKHAMSPSIIGVYYPNPDTIASSILEATCLGEILPAVPSVVNAEHSILSMETRGTHSRWTPVDVEHIFYTFPLSRSVPFVKLVKQGIASFKIHAPFVLANDDAYEEVQSFCTDDETRRSKDIVVFRAFTKYGVDWHLAIDNMGHQVVNVALTDRFDSISTEDINNGLQLLSSEVLDHLGLPKMSIGDVYRFSTRVNVTVQGRSFSVKDVYPVIRDHFASYFDIMQYNTGRKKGSTINDPSTMEGDRGVLWLYYRLSDGYAPMNDARRFILNNRKIDKGTVIGYLVEKLNMDIADAKVEYERTAAQNRIIRINVSNNTLYGIEADIINLSNTRQFAKIRSLLSMAAAIASGAVPPPAAVRPPYAGVPAALAPHEDEFLALLDGDVLTPRVDSASRSQPEATSYVPEKYLINQLYNADKELFSYRHRRPGERSYASDCQKAFQPLPLTDEQLSNQPKGTVALGVRGVWYVCPKAWCPKSHVAVEPGDQCPLPGEQPIVYSATNNNKPRYVGFRRSKSGFGQCVPCCKLTNNDLKVDECGGKLINAEFARKPKAQRERYVKSTDVPVESGRFGLIPTPISLLFKNATKCGTREDGTGNVRKNTRCFVRRGLPLPTGKQPQPFLDAVSMVLNKKDIVDRIIENLDPSVFVMAERGKLVRMFADSPAAIRASMDIALSTARAFLENNPAYVDAFRIAHVVTKMSSDGAGSDISVMREMLIASAWRNFISYLQDPNVVKTHEALLDIVSLRTDWLNAHGINFVVLEESNAKAPLPKVIMDIATTGILPNGHVAMLCKHMIFYEPICLLERKRPLELTFERSVVPEVNAICNLAESNRHEVLPKLIAALDVRLIAIDNNYCATGVQLRSGAYLPLPHPEAALGYLHLRKFVYMDELQLRAIDVSELTAVAKSANAASKGDYVVRKITKRGIELDNGHTIPFGAPEERLMIDTAILTGAMEADERVEHVSKLVPDVYVRARADLFKKCSVDAKLHAEIRFASEIGTGIPYATRVAILRTLIKEAISGAPDTIIHRIADEMVRAPLLYGVSTYSNRDNATSVSDVVIYPEDIAFGKVDDILQGIVSRYRTKRSGRTLRTMTGGQTTTLTHFLIEAGSIHVAGFEGAVKEIVAQAMCDAVPDGEPSMLPDLHEIPDAIGVDVVVLSPHTTNVSKVFGGNNEYVAVVTHDGTRLAANRSTGSVLFPRNHLESILNHYFDPMN